jgi:hypothetical protein
VKVGSRRSEIGTLFAILVLCAAPRIAAMAVWPPSPTHDSEIAENLADHGRYVLDGLPATFIEPLSPAAFAAGRLMFGSSLRAMLSVPLAFGSVAGLALFALTRRTLGSERAAWIATVLYACSPYLVRQSASLMEVTLATAILITAGWRIGDVRTGGQAAAAGMLLGAAVLTRFSFLPITLGGLWVIHRHAGLNRSGIAASLVIACVAPWLVYSYAAGGAALPARIGENLFESTNQWATALVPRVNVDLLASVADGVARDRLARNGIAEYGMAERDRALLDEVRDYVRAHPIQTMTLKIRNLAYAFQPRLLPFTERKGDASIVDARLVIPEQRRRPLAYEVAAAGFQSVLLVGAACGLAKRRRHLEQDAFLLIVFGSIVAVCVVFYPTSRLLAPASFVLMFFTAACLERNRARVDG